MPSILFFKDFPLTLKSGKPCELTSCACGNDRQTSLTTAGMFLAVRTTLESYDINEGYPLPDGLSNRKPGFGLSAGLADQSVRRLA